MTPPDWLLQELQEDLQDAAVDLGRAIGAGVPTEPFEEAYNRASEDLRAVLSLLRQQTREAAQRLAQAAGSSPSSPARRRPSSK